LRGSVGNEVLVQKINMVRWNPVCFWKARESSPPPCTMHQKEDTEYITLQETWSLTPPSVAA